MKLNKLIAIAAIALTASVASATEKVYCTKSVDRAVELLKIAETTNELYRASIFDDKGSVVGAITAYVSNDQQTMVNLYIHNPGEYCLTLPKIITKRSFITLKGAKDL
jgi:uncharacterized protein YcfJ